MNSQFGTGRLHRATQKTFTDPHKDRIRDAIRQAQEDCECGVNRFDELACTCDKCRKAYESEVDLCVEKRR